MARRRSNPRLAKIHRTYTVEEAARLYGVHRNTVRQWIKQGLSTCDQHRPLLILGSDLGRFLRAKTTANKRPCKPGQAYCVKCREPRTPALGMADYQAITPGSGNLVGLCPDCGTLMYRRVNLAKLLAVQGSLEVRITEARKRIDESNRPSVNSDFKQG